MSESATPRSVLVLTHEFPPSAGGGVQRVAKFCKYLPVSGWRPQVVTSAPIEGRPTDATLVHDVADVPVTRLPQRDVATAVARLIAPFKPRRLRRGADTGVSSTLVSSLNHRPLSARIAEWLSVPDGAMPWAYSAVRFVASANLTGIDAVLASGPPHSTLVAGERIARELDVPFIADMRDAWRDRPVRHTPTRMHRRAAEALERRVMSRSVCVLAASEPIAEEARAMGARRVVVVPNGFDPEDIPLRPQGAASSGSLDPGRPLRLAFMGRFYGVTDPTTTFQAIALARNAGIDIVLDVVGPDVPAVVARAEEVGVASAVRFLGYRPHRAALDVVAKADVALVTLADVPEARAIYTGKIFEYLGMRMPILLVGAPDGVAADLITEAGAGWAVGSGDPSAICDMLIRIADIRQAGNLPAADTGVVDRYRRASLTSVLAAELDAAVGDDA